MTNPPRPLTANQLRAARMLARGATGKATAAAVGVTPETISHWRQNPAFNAEIQRAVDLAKDGDPRTRADALAPRALDALASVLTNNRADQGLRVQAAAAILAFIAAPRRPDTQE